MSANCFETQGCQIEGFVRALGCVRVGQAVADAIGCLADASAPTGVLPPVDEARQWCVFPSGRKVLLVDSASLIRPDDAGEIVVAGSHGGLIGGDPARAAKADVRVVAFNDAGVGSEGAGVTRLAALDRRGIGAASIDHTSARIGDATSMMTTGVISHANAMAVSLGAFPGQDLLAWLEALPKD